MTTTDESPALCFERHTADVYRWAYRVLGRHHDALDVVQDVFLKWVRQCRTKQPEHARGWLRRVTVNRAIDLTRRREPAAPAAAEPTRARPHGDSQDGIGMDRVDLRADIHLALERLTEMQRSVLIAKVFDAMTFARIAVELGVGVPTVKTHYLRAVRVVRDRLQGKWALEETP